MYIKFYFFIIILEYNKIEKTINKQYKSFNGAEKRDLIISKLSKDMGWIYEKEKN